MHHLLGNPLTLLLLQFVVIIVLSRLVSLGMRRMGQPLVIAEVVAGIVLGPSVLGLLAPGALQALFPASSLPLLGNLSQVGLLLFMFVIGLEFDPALLKGRGRASVLISHMSIVVPFALGVAAGALWLYEPLAPRGVPASSFVLFMGVSMSITAFPVLARILSERGLLRSQVGILAITCAAVDDVTAWCLLAFIVSVVKAESHWTAVITTGVALAYVVVMLRWARPLLARLTERVTRREGLTHGVIAIALVLLFCSAMITELIGIHALFGAFLFGAIVPRATAAALAKKFEDLTLVLLLPLFFAYSGLRTQLGLLDSVETWLQCGAIILLACLGKFGGSIVAARYTGMPWREASAVAVLMNTRGLMELVVLNLGLDIGVISPTLFTMMVLMALVTTFLTTPVLQKLYPNSVLEAASLPPLGPEATAAR